VKRDRSRGGKFDMVNQIEREVSETVSPEVGAGRVGYECGGNGRVEMGGPTF